MSAPPTAIAFQIAKPALAIPQKSSKYIMDGQE